MTPAQNDPAQNGPDARRPQAPAEAYPAGYASQGSAAGNAAAGPLSAGSSRRHILRSAGIVGIMTTISRIFGYIRDAVLAAVLGASNSMDAFTVAFRLANLLRRLVAEGSMTAVFIPVFTQYEKTQPKDKVWEFVGTFTTTLGFVLSGIVLFNIALAPWLIRILAPGFASIPGKWELTVFLNRIMAPYLLFIGLAALDMAVLNTRHRFGIPAAAPILLNCSIILCALGLTPLFPERATGVAIGALIGGILQWVCQLPSLFKIGFRWHWKISFTHPEIRRMGRLIVPGLFGIGITQFELIFGSFVASFLDEGSVSSLYYADRVMELALGIFAISLATVILPILSRLAAEKKIEEMKHTMVTIMRDLSFITIPATVGLMVLATPIVQVLFEHGRFTAFDTQRTSFALLFFGLGLFFFSAVKVVVPVFYSLTDMKTPVRIAAIAFLVNVALTLLLVFPLKQGGIALAASLGAAFQLVALLWIFRRRFGALGLKEFLWSMMRVVGASLVMGAFCWWFLHAVGFAHQTKILKTLLLFAGIGLAMVLYLAVCLLIGVREVHEWKDILKQKFKPQISENSAG